MINRMMPPKSDVPQIYGHGLLYTFAAVNTGLLAPVGCHVPTLAEFQTLSTFLGGDSVSGGKMTSTRTSAPYFSENVGATNESRFTSYGAGRRSQAGSFNGLETLIRIWTRDEYSSTNGYNIEIVNNAASLSISNSGKEAGFSIRCLVDDGDWWHGRVIKDIDGNTYNTVKIGTQVWLQSNLKTTHYNEGTAIPNITGKTEWAALTTGAYCCYNNSAIVEITSKQSQLE